MSQPCDRVCFAGTCTMLYEIILCRAIHAHITKHLTNDIQLMIARENQIFRPLDFTCCIINLFLAFYKNKFADKVNHSIFCQNIFPHIRDTVFIFISRISCTSSNAGSISHIEWKKECRITSQFSGHVHLFQIHRKVYQASSFKTEQTSLRAALRSKLINCILIGLSCSIALKLK